MQRKVEVDEAIARGQLLTLVQQQGRAKEALVCFVPLALSLLQRISIQSSTSAVLSLLNAAIERRQPAWTQGLIAERKTKRQRTSDSSQRDAVFSAKLVQNLVKAYAPISVATIKAGEMEDLIAAMDLACVALYVVCALEHTVRLGDLVVDNLLYQVAKKYGEIPKMLEAASCVTACVHARLWLEHTKLCKASGEDGKGKSQLMICLQDSSSTDVIAHRVVKKLDILAEFPKPSSCHSAQFTRLLVGYMNICVTLLVAAQKHEAVRLLAEATLSPWIDHLEKTSGQSSKLASSFRDRTFRILWKCATALEKGDQNSSKASSTALLFRSTALTFVLRCSNYTSEYFIQQVHRVAVQHERISKRSPQGLEEVCAFYDRSMDALLQTIPNSAYTSKSLQWEYLQWLEHYAFICETLGMHLESTMILEKALHYVRLFGTTGKPIQSCLRLSVAGALFSASDSTKQDVSSHLRTFGKRLRCEAGRTMADRILCTSPDKLPEECKRIAQVYLEKLDKSIASSFESLGEQDFVKFVPFVIRCVKRSSTKLFNYTISVQHSATSRHVAKSFGEICKALKKLSTSAEVDRNFFETLISEELRLHRMAVVLSVRSCLGDTCSSPTEPVLEMISTQLSSVHDLLKDACMDGDKSTKSILQGFRGDLKSILRECYSCASRCYKVGTYSEVIATLSGAFNLAQSYVEYVMSSTASADEKHEVYAHLKVDEMALLLAHCFREIGNISSSRQYIGHALLYCADIKDNIPYAAIDKYVCCIMDEAKELGDGMEDSVVNTCTSFWATMHRVLKSRGVSEDQRLLLWRTFRCALNGASEKVVDNARVEDEGAHSSFEVAESFVNSCGTLQSYLDGILVKDKLKAVNGHASSLENILSNVSQSLAKRKQVFYHWYHQRDFNAAIQGLALVHHSLTLAAETLQSFAGAASVDLGGVLGWRGILVIELTLIASYAGFPECEVTNENITYENAIADIEKCLKYWTKGDTPGFLFDEPYIISCLSSICNTLSLLSCSSLETAARKLLNKLQQSVNIQEVIAPPRFGLFGFMFYQQNGLGLDKQGFTPSSTDCTVESKLFEQADQALVAAKISSDKGRTCQSMLDVITILGKIKPRMRQCQAVTVAKAIGMREMLVHMILSEFYFHEGRSNCAIKEAKIALSICWKMAKKSTALFASTDAWSFNLPSQLSGKKSRERHSAHVLCFMALESSSWDVLHAAKLLLCRIALLYISFDQPHRATVYLTEAMRLVGGLNLPFFRREPFYEYAELELSACHLEKAKVAISLLTFRPTAGSHHGDGSIMLGYYHPYMQSDVVFIEQTCNEIVQQGDVHKKEGHERQALACFEKTLEKLNAVEDRESRLPESLRRVKARCWRKYTQLLSESSDLADSTAVEALLLSMMKLEQAMEVCGVYLERIKCMLLLGCINVRLVRSASRVFTSLDRTVALLEEAYWLGEKLGIPYLSQDLRKALGMAYLAEIETVGAKATSQIDSNRLTFLVWMSSVLLANAGSAGMAIKEIAGVENDREKVTGESFRLQLERLAASSSSTSQDHEQPSDLASSAESIAKQVQELPDNWVIVSLMVTLSSELVITRFPTNGLTPALFCLPTVDWKHFVCEMEAIIQDSREGLSGHTAQEASSWSIDQKKNWWSTRKALDKRIEELLVSMQTMLGFWRCLFVGGSSTFTKESIQRCWELIVSSKMSSTILMERNQTLLCAIADAQHWLSDDEIIDGLRYIAAEMGAPVSDGIVHKALQVLRNKQTDRNLGSTLATLSTERIAKLKVSEIKHLLALEGLSTDGLKKVLIQRLIDARDAALANELKSPLDCARDEVDSHFSTILILHHELQQFPWEGLDVMTQCRGVTRMPSLDLILENVKRSPSIRRDRVRFLLNPAGDLSSTQHQLSPILERGSRTYGWEGIIGQVPDTDVLRNYTVTADLYIYCGHGSGEAYLPRDKVLSSQPTCCAALLFGCSSGRLEREGIFGPNGAVLAYLRAGSPAVLAMLWDVTDRDIDQLSVKVLDKWLLDTDINNSKLSLAQVLQESRDVCKLKYLNGHAAICYGLPLYVATC